MESVCRIAHERHEVSAIYVEDSEPAIRAQFREGHSKRIESDAQRRSSRLKAIEARGIGNPVKQAKHSLTGGRHADPRAERVQTGGPAICRTASACVPCAESGDSRRANDAPGDQDPASLRRQFTILNAEITINVTTLAMNSHPDHLTGFGWLAEW